jgi:tRNA (guanine6-N2)-methyltransferase
MLFMKTKRPPHLPNRSPTADRPKKAAAPQARRYEAQLLDGLKPFAEREITRLLGRESKILESADSEALPFLFAGDMRRLLQLRTVVAVYLVEAFAVPRPRALLGHEHLSRLLERLKLVRAVAEFQSFRFAAAGRESSVFLRLAEALAGATGLAHDPEEGELLLRVRPSGGGWEVLARLSPRPLSARHWRVCNLEGGLNATVAAAMLSCLETRPNERFLNLMCGSGTLLVERLLQAPAARAIGVDLSSRALDCSRENLHAAGVLEAVELYEADATALPFAGESFEAIVADLPWGDRVGSHAENLALYPRLLVEVQRVASTQASFVLLTHDVRLFEKVLEGQDGWTLRESHRVYHGGHYPRIYVLERLALAKA